MLLAHCDEYKKEAFSRVVCTSEWNRSLNNLPLYFHRLPQKLLSQFPASQSHGITSRKRKKKEKYKIDNKCHRPSRSSSYYSLQA